MKQLLLKLERELVWRAISLTDELYVCRLYGKGSLVEGFLEIRLIFVELVIEIIVNFREMFYGK